MSVYYGSIEAGGTKFVLAIADEHFNIIKKCKFATTTPQETISKTIKYFKENRVSAIGLGSFGPIDLNLSSKTYGYITSTPKVGWKNINLVGQLKEALDIPIYFTTDVNASAYGEMKNTGIKNLVYLTIGTGIGGGAIQDGYFIGGIGHSEMGHQRINRHRDDLTFEGSCPFHGDCLEGVAAGPSLEARTGILGEKIPSDDPIWDILSYYIAQAAINATLTLAPECIILGGGVMEKSNMISLIQKHFISILNNYIDLPCSVEKYIRLPTVKENGSATLGNFYLAYSLFTKE
ncbi:ROK family protein [Lactococcus lactis subsp. lactis]|uniref:fructokinase ScrK n=1 Tax=Lactococcus lactis TaxID=1358 RepID=UPI001BAB1A1D|nr:fructokinase ScrK [Lactococcus lactis]MDT3325205.1 ROK family protein [Bacillota bacterium]MBR8680635.1 ROK family protein [Lactococcus lactis subsp. lactis]MBR8682938.1 ROK family protein [Lactococcus lactis subsp. lactis]MBR8687636.1 ROK family protein [Lactococcus lactis subsp. lactis]MBS3731140.1 ROK family protein [Lactococcus lactis subsp. lactis]